MYLDDKLAAQLSLSVLQGMLLERCTDVFRPAVGTWRAAILKEPAVSPGRSSGLGLSASSTGFHAASPTCEMHYASSKQSITSEDTTRGEHRTLAVRMTSFPRGQLYNGSGLPLQQL